MNNLWSGVCPRPAQAGRPGHAREGSAPAQSPYGFEAVCGHSPTRPRVSHPTVADEASISEYETPEVVPVQNESASGSGSIAGRSGKRKENHMPIERST